MTPNEELIDAALNCDILAAQSAIERGANLKFRTNKTSESEPRLDYQGSIEASAILFCLMSKNNIIKKRQFLFFLLQQPGFNCEDGEHCTWHNVNAQHTLPGGLYRPCPASPLVISASQLSTYSLTLPLLIRGANARRTTAECVINRGAFSRASDYKVNLNIINLFQLFSKFSIPEWRNAYESFLQNEFSPFVFFLKPDDSYDAKYVNLTCLFWLYCILDKPQHLPSVFSEEFTFIFGLNRFEAHFQDFTYFEVAADLGNSRFFIELYLNVMIRQETRADCSIQSPNFHCIIKLAKNSDYLAWQKNEDKQKSTEAQLILQGITTHNLSILSLILFTQHDEVWRDEILGHLDHYFDECFVGSENDMLAWVETALLEKYGGMQNQLARLAHKIIEKFPNLLAKACLDGSLESIKYLLTHGAKAQSLSDAVLYQVFTRINHNEGEGDNKLALILLNHGANAEWNWRHPGENINIKRTPISAVLKSALPDHIKIPLITGLIAKQAPLTDAHHPTMMDEVCRLQINPMEVQRNVLKAHGSSVQQLFSDQKDTTLAIAETSQQLQRTQEVVSAHESRLLEAVSRTDMQTFIHAIEAKHQEAIEAYQALRVQQDTQQEALECFEALFKRLFISLSQQQASESGSMLASGSSYAPLSITSTDSTKVDTSLETRVKELEDKNAALERQVREQQTETDGLRIQLDRQEKETHEIRSQLTAIVAALSQKSGETQTKSTTSFF